MRALAILLLCAGCMHEASQTCGNGGVCPAGLSCVDTERTTIDGRICASGTCGDGVRDPDEACDDGNHRSGDGCPADCTAPCGDGVIDPGEACDDGNTTDGDGCSADCQSLERQFGVVPGGVRFTAVEGGALPDAVTVDVSLEFPGDSVLIGFAPGVAEPSWLSIEEGVPHDDRLELAFRATDTDTVGVRVTTVRLTLGHQSSAAIEMFDLTIIYTVQPADLAIQATPSALTFTAEADDVDVASQTLDLAFNGAAARVVSSPPWLTLALSGTALEVGVADTHYPADTTLSGDIVMGTSRASIEHTTTVHVDYRITAAPALSISAVPASLVFTAFAGAPLPAAQTVEVSFAGTSLEVGSQPAWLTITPGPLSSPASFTIAANTTGIAATEGDVVFITGRGGRTDHTVLHVDYHVLPRPEAQFAAPYLGVAGRAGSLNVRGHGFATAGPITLALGELAIGPLTPDSDTQITLPYPALPAGRYPITFVAPAGIARPQLALVVLTTPSFGYQAFDTAGDHSGLVYDAERQALYAVNRTAQQIERYAFRDGQWSALPPKVVPDLVDLALAPDGASLFVLRPTELDEISLTDGTFTLVPRATYVPWNTEGAFAKLMMPDDGNAWLLTGWRDLRLYSLIDHSLSDAYYFPFYTFDDIALSGDGRWLYYLTDLYGSMQVQDTGTSTTTRVKIADYSDGLKVGNDASRVIVSSRWVYDRALNRLGDLSLFTSRQLIVSRDSTRVFSYTHDPEDPPVRVDVYDLTQAGFPRIKSVVLPERASDGIDRTQMVSTVDDSAVVVSGSRKLLIVPVTP